MSAFDRSTLKACGDDVYIDEGTVIKRPGLVSIGSHVALDHGVFITTHAEIGDYVHIACYVSIIGGSEGHFTIGNFATIAAGSRVICGSDDYMGKGLIGPTIPKQYQVCYYEPIVIEPFAAIGTNAVIMPGARVREGAVIGAGAVLTKDTEPWTIYVGSPAKPLKPRPSHTILRYAQALGYYRDRVID